MAAQACRVDKFIIAAICDRESGGGVYLIPRGPAGKGDQGFGHGLMQIDSRFHGKWLQTHEWWKPEVNIAYGAQLLRENFDHFKGDEFPAVAAYNCSRVKVDALVNACWADLSARNLLIDRLTTYANYASDVLERAEKFREMNPRISAV